MSDSSSYQLSSKLLQALTRTGVMGKANLSPTEVIAEIFASLKEEWQEKDRLGLFYGVLNRRTFDFTYLAYGDFWLLQSGNAFSWHLMGNGTAHLQQQSSLSGQERKLQLQPGERLLLASDGVREAIGADMEQISESTFRHPDLDGQSIVNELSYSVKKGLGGEFPPQDCSLLLFTMPDKALRLAQ